jgi:hypothetical protein
MVYGGLIGFSADPPAYIFWRMQMVFHSRVAVTFPASQKCPSSNDLEQAA